MLQYNKVLQGWKAIAVLAIIIYHVKIYYHGNFLLSGGFLAINIFFIVSGYLSAKKLSRFKYTEVGSFFFIL